MNPRGKSGNTVAAMQSPGRERLAGGRHGQRSSQSDLGARGSCWEEASAAFRLLLLYAEKEPIKFGRAALRWLARYVTEGKAVSLLKAQLTLSALAELRAGDRERAAKMLTEFARRQC
jgi:hypothetical protein